MKGLYFNPMYYPHNSGVENKIQAQIQAFGDLGIEMDTITFSNDYNGEIDILLNGIPKERIVSKGLYNKLRNFLSMYKGIYKIIYEKQYSFIYFRYNYSMTPSLLMLVHKLHRKGIKILTEIPTFPYDGEFKMSIGSSVDRILRKMAARAYTRIVTFSTNTTIWNRPTSIISNGIDLKKIPLRQSLNKSKDTFTMVAVAQLAYWHGVDRVIEGIYNYISEGGKRKIDFYLISGVENKELKRLKDLVKKRKLENNVHFEGAKYGKDIDRYFDICDVAIGSLGRHRNNIYSLKTLKNVEYAARGVPFVYSESNCDFDNKEYVLRIPPNECPIDLDSIINFIDSLRISKEQIRTSIAGLDWKCQMTKVVVDSLQIE